MRYPVESFTADERALLAPPLHQPRPPRVRPRQPAGDGQGRAVRALLALFRHAAAAVPRGVRRRRRRRRAALRRGRGRARRGAVRAGLHRLRRRLDRPGRRRPRRLRVGLQRPHQAPAARPPRRLSRAVDPLHPLRPPIARRRLPLLPRRRSSAPSIAAAMDELFETYSRRPSSRSRPGRRSAGRAATEPEGAWRSSIRAKALDLLRGLLPASTLSHVGIYASGQAYEQLLLRLVASPLPEAREYGEMMLTELQQVIPSFVARVDRPDRGGDWVALPARAPRGHRASGRPARTRSPRQGEQRPLGRADPRRRHRGRPAGRPACSRRPGVPESEVRARVDALDPIERAGCSQRLAGERPTAATARDAAGRRCATGSRSSPTTAASATSSATGCSPASGSASAPTSAPACPTRSARRGSATSTSGRSSVSRTEFDRLEPTRALPEAAPYALCLGYRIRYVLDLNAREAMHLIELRSGREGHPTYRAVAQAMHERIAAVHPAVAAAMVHVDTTTRAPPRAHPQRDPHPPQANRSRRAKRRRGANRPQPARLRGEPSGGRVRTKS